LDAMEFHSLISVKPRRFRAGSSQKETGRDSGDTAQMVYRQEFTSAVYCSAPSTRTDSSSEPSHQFSIASHAASFVAKNSHSSSSPPPSN